MSADLRLKEHRPRLFASLAHRDKQKGESDVQQKLTKCRISLIFSAARRPPRCFFSSSLPFLLTLLCFCVLRCSREKKMFHSLLMPAKFPLKWAKRKGRAPRDFLLALRLDVKVVAWWLSFAKWRRKKGGLLPAAFWMTL